MIKKYRFIVFLLAILVFTGCQKNDIARPPSAEQSPKAPEQTQSESVPYQPHGDYVWEVQGGESRVYLIGTMHLVRPEYGLTPQVAELLADCDALAVESDTENREMMADILEISTYSDGTDLYDHLSERGRAHLEWLCEQYSIQPQMLAAYKPMLIPSFFVLLPALDRGFSDKGVDHLLMAEAQAAGKPLLELEDGIDTFEHLNSLPVDTMERVCILPISGPDAEGEKLQTMYELFIDGDADKLRAYMEDTEVPDSGDGSPIEFEEKDDLYLQYMLDDRNRNMADSLEEWLETPDRDVFAAAGVAHFLGEGSIIELLEAAGYTVERVEITPGVPEQSAAEKKAA